MPAVLPLSGMPPCPRTGRRTLSNPRCALPVVGILLVAAFAVRLLADLLGRAAVADPVGLLSIGIGVLAVAVVLAPVAVLSVARTRAAWARAPE
ncbi:hypothetical protein HL658_22800 [Azospirillum sp. RWY-5-1]|uniref:Uncharacterized protein n=1 Tax=Azospirillum oleiclasticum TaxID=2735135 RepID=A0ABX2TDC7_9PROT|nr:hypothetical protein [Azospirillum oleiclasticum]NYZ15377.1 hypothetical protein [Azospirillum oleiclasticum]NYZ21202.1 hypothetical protein [Azospirillum oleiclasticum]